MEIRQSSEIRRSDREHWLDFAKGIGIILVVYAHAISRDAYIWVLINQFHMPLFFLISGYLYRTKENWGEFLIGKIRSLWLPYVVSSIITSIVGAAMGTGIGVKNLIKMVLLLDHGPLLGATWFLQVLFYSVILYDLITRLVNRVCRARVEAVIMIITTFCLVIGLFTHLPYHGSVILNTVFFLHIGQLMKNHPQWEDWKVPVFFLLLCVCAGISVINRTSYSTNTYTNPLLFPVGALIGSIGVIGICKHIYRENIAFRALSFLGEKSMGPVIWHFVAFKIVIALQIIVYQLSWSQLSDFPVIYDYAFGIWVLLDIVIGIGISILIYMAINTPVDKLARKLEKRVVKRHKTHI